MNFPVDPVGMGQLGRDALIAGMPEDFYPGTVCRALIRRHVRSSRAHPEKPCGMKRVAGFVIALLLGQALPAVAQPVKFGDQLFDKFQHERCLSCHQFGSREHNGRSFTSHRSRYLCAQCHQPKLIGMPAGSTWEAPQDMDYTGFGAVKTCKLIKQRIGYDPDGRRLAGHMLNDARVRWALESGITPGGPLPTVPGGYAEWRVDVEAWIKDGMRCE